jgi:hypothetical protein
LDTQVVLWIFGASQTVTLAAISAMWAHKNKAHDAMWQQIHANARENAALRVHIAEKYVSLETMEKSMGKMEKIVLRALEEVNASLDNLAREFHQHQINTAAKVK